jgi:hypothetical protein
MSLGAGFEAGDFGSSFFPGGATAAAAGFENPNENETPS